MSNLVKSSYVVKKDTTRVIDSNELVASRLQELSEKLASKQEEVRTEDSDGFTVGLNAEQLEMLFEDKGDDADFEGGEQVENTDLSNEYDVEAVNVQAEQILNEARENAEEMLENARAQTEEIKKDAYESGKKEGYDAGYAEGMQIVSQIKAEYAEKERLLNESYEQRIEELEPDLVDAITDIYEYIFHISLSSNREIMLNLIHDTVRNVEGGKNFIVHISKNDFEYVNDRKEQLTDGLGSTDTVEVIEDLTLKQSECFVETESGIYDCGIGTELELLKKELMLLSYRKE